MFKKRNYVIKGITRNLAEKWDKECRDDLTFVVDRNGKIEGRISLTKFQALLIRLGIIKFNLTHPYLLKLEKCKSKKHAA